jgi:hypothetical protein
MDSFDKNTHNEIVKLMDTCPVYSESLGKYAEFMKYPKQNIDQLYAAHVWASSVSSCFLNILNHVEEAIKSSLIKVLVEHLGDNWHKRLNTYKMTQPYEGIERTKFSFWTELLKHDCLKDKNNSVFCLGTVKHELFEIDVDYDEVIKVIDKIRHFRNNIIHHRVLWEINPDNTPKNIHELIRDLKKNHLIFFMTLQKINKNKAYFFSKRKIIENFDNICSIDNLNHLIYEYSDPSLRNKIDMEIQKILKKYTCPKSDYY